MPKFQVEITETLQKVVTVSANSIEDAIFKVKKKYRNQEIVLDSEDFKGTDFSEFSTK